MRRTLGAAVLVLAASVCRPTTPSAPPPTLLFFGRSPAAFLAGLSWAADPRHSQVIAFDARLRVARVIANPRLASPMAVAPLGKEDLLVTERTGEGVVLDTAGRLVREWESPHPAALYAAAGSRVIAVRSPYLVQLVAEADTAPLLRVLDTLGRPVEGLATIHVPPVSLLVQLTNAGAVAEDGSGAVYFAPLVRDEIRKYDRTGAARWTTRRGLLREEAEPEFLPARGRELPVRHAIVNIALALGPDGKLYALGAEDSTARRLRLDVLDTASGAILATRRLTAGETSVAVDRAGRVVTFDAETLLARAAEKRGGREPFAPAFALPNLKGDTVRLADYAGRVTLVNFWASWCDPCREEFPHMAQLYGEFDRTTFEIAAISDDVDRGKMLAFVREFRPPFPILVGGGRMKQLYHYRGLPYSVLLDARGRAIERIFGFGGAAEFQRLRETIAKEVRAP